MTGWWGVFGRGWPFELLLAGVALIRIAKETGSPWMLIPTGLVLGNGYLMSFYAITDAWPLWVFLWPLELIIVFGSIFVPIRLAKRPDRGRKIGHSLGQILVRPTLVVAMIVVVLGAIVG